MPTKVTLEITADTRKAAADVRQLDADVSKAFASIRQQIGLTSRAAGGMKFSPAGVEAGEARAHRTSRSSSPS